MQAEEWVRRIEEAGLSPILVPVLEIARALGFVAAQALIFGQPLLNGLVDEEAINRTTTWLEDPRQVEALLDRLSEEGNRR